MRVNLLLRLAFCAAFLLAGAAPALGQVSPAEILNPQLKADEQNYLHQLQAFNLDIQSIKFPFPFHLTRYVSLDPQQQPAMDTRGVEFRKFHDRIVLKTTGIYGAAFSADRVTQNERASRVFTEVVVPILEILPKDIPADVTCDAIGFEISYHVRSRKENYDYEGKEILVVVFDKTGAYEYPRLSRESQRQAVLDRSEIYLNGEQFGLALSGREAYNVEGLERSNAHKSTPAPAVTAPPASADSQLVVQRAEPAPQPSTQPAGSTAAEAPKPTPPSPVAPATTFTPVPQTPPAGAATQADADRLQAQFQTQLDAFAKAGASFHFVDYAPPSFVIFRGRIFMQLSMRNPQNFEKESSSIYKRAAQSFDLFLAPQLKALLDKIPAGAEIEGLDITVLNQLASKPKASSEAVEFICPMKAARQFTDAEITNQDLINQSVVLVNGVRIVLDLQRVE